MHYFLSNILSSEEKVFVIISIPMLKVREKTLEANHKSSEKCENYFLGCKISSEPYFATHRKLFEKPTRTTRRTF